MLVAMATGVALAYIASPSRRTLAAGAVALSWLVHPLMAVVLAASGATAHQLRRIRRVRGESMNTADEAILALELVGLGVTAGLPFRSAASLTVEQLDGSISHEMARALRSVGAGLQPSIISPDIQAMFSAAQASETTGTPLSGALNAIALDRRKDAAAASREHLAKLPVKMLFPLALLILPGFVLLTVAPPLISGLSRLGL